MTEAVSGAFIQGAAIFSSTKFRTTTAFLSLTASITAAAFLSTLLSYEWDTNSSSRKTAPDFYRYIPNSMSRKISCFMALFLLSAFNLVVRTLVCLTVASRAIVVVFLVIELALFFVYKLVRGDLIYWPPFSGWPAKVVAALFMQLIAKLIVDWTACVQFRHPMEVGGMYFCFSMAMTVGVGFASTLAYKQDGELPEKYIVTLLMSSACAGLFLSFVSLLLSMKREYVGTFVSLKTGSSYVQELFKNGNDDERRFVIFYYVDDKWIADIGDEVRVWLNERLPEWSEITPDWLDKRKLKKIPDWIDNASCLQKILAAEKSIKEWKNCRLVFYSKASLFVSNINRTILLLRPNKALKHSRIKIAHILVPLVPIHKLHVARRQLCTAVPPNTRR